MQNFLDLYTGDDDIIKSEENSIPINLLENDNKLSLIIGSEKSGKTSLAKAYSKLNQAELIFDISLSIKNHKKTYLDLNYLNLADENLFHFLQYFISQDIGLTIFTSTDPLKVDENQVFLPDVISRLSLFNIARIENPRDKLFFKLIQKFLKNLSITISDQMINEVMKFIDRSYIDAFNASKTINYLLYENNHNINLSLIRQHYEQI